MRGLFVTGTDTGVGKTVVAGAICAALAARGERVTAFKPVVTGLDEPAGGGWPADHELLAAAAGGGAPGRTVAGGAAPAGGAGAPTPHDVAPYRFGPAVSPHYAAELAGARVDPARLRDVACEASAGADALICEGVGGLLVPLADGYLVRDLAADLALALVVVARTGLGTINHTLLTVEAARAAGLPVAAIVMTPWPADPEPIETSNRSTVERLTGIPVATLAPTSPATLAAAGAALPLDDWL